MRSRIPIKLIYYVLYILLTIPFLSQVIYIYTWYISSFPRLPTKAMTGHVGATWGGSFWRV